MTGGISSTTFTAPETVRDETSRSLHTRVTGYLPVTSPSTSPVRDGSNSPWSASQHVKNPWSNSVPTG